MRSHFLPAAAYRIMRDEKLKNPNPYLLTKVSAAQTSWQMRAHLLCHECEQRFQANGESWVFKRCLQKDGSFPLQDILASRRPEMGSGQTTEVHYAVNIAEMNVAALAYFAASMFWRGSIHGWNLDGSVPVKLGPFQEPIRRYLMGESAFPPDCALWIALPKGRGAYEQLTYAPCGERQDGFHGFRFPMAGIAFSMLVSKHLPQLYKNMCFVHGAGNPVFRTVHVDKWVERDAVRMITSNSRLLNAVRNAG